MSCHAPYSTTGLLYFTIDLMPRLPFITFEGSEGCGKSTQVKRLAARLERSRIPFLVTRERAVRPSEKPFASFSNLRHTTPA